MANQRDHPHALSTFPRKSTLKQSTAKARGLSNEVLNIAVTGESGSGKSSFVNAIRGLSDTDEGAALVDEDECTKEPTAYPHPTLPNVNIWDLPGVGTSTFNASSYTKTVKFETYDFFIIVSATRFKENDIKLAEEIRKRNRQFYFVRSKMDIDVANSRKRGCAENETLETVRDRCVRNLSELGAPTVFLITSHDLTRFDFPQLVDTLERNLPELWIKPDRAKNTGSVFSFLKAIRTLTVKHARSAPVREVQTPMKSKKKISEIKNNIWDPPGIGATVFNVNPENKTDIEKAREIVDSLENVVLNIAVTGESGAGKSSFVNAIRGLSDTDEGAALVDEEECTMDPTAYPHPTLPNVKIWDLPGVGTSTFDASSYTKKMNFNIYDIFIIISATRFKENDIKLVKEIQKNKKNFYFVRSKLDIDIANAGKRHITEEETLRKIRDRCMENLYKMKPPVSELGYLEVFLISSHDLTKFDFPKLIDRVEKDLPKNKRTALILGLPVYSQRSVEKKYKKFKKSIWAFAVVSGGIAAAPVPGLSAACDVAMAASFLTKCYHSFGLDDKSLIKLGNRVNKPILEKVKESKLIQALATRAMLSPELLIRLGLAGALETAISFVPVAGSVIAAGVSFATTKVVLTKGLKELYNAAKIVIEMAELK